MKKIIGITTSLNKTQNTINSAYIKAFTTEDTTPILIPNIFESQNEITTKKERDNLIEHLNEITSKIDALVLSGGTDINPVSFNEKLKDSTSFSYTRDYIETELIKICIRKKIPVLGICRGFQMLGIALGIRNFQQDISICKEKHNGLGSDISNRKEPMHYVSIFGNFKEYCKEQEILEDKILTNSWHEQGFTLHPKGERINNKDLASFITKEVDYLNEDKKEILNDFPGINIIMSTNYVIEGFEHKLLPLLAYQFHPEEYTNSITIKYFLEKYVKKTYKEKETSHT